MAMQAAAGVIQAGQIASCRHKPQYLLDLQRKWIWMAGDLDKPQPRHLES